MTKSCAYQGTGQVWSRSCAEQGLLEPHADRADGLGHRWGTGGCRQAAIGGSEIQTSKALPCENVHLGPGGLSRSQFRFNV
jgi:hypothetical protein